MSDLNKLIYDNPDINFTLIGMDEFAKGKTSTLFFLSKYSYLGDNLKFIKSKDIGEEWKKCDVWVTDDKKIIDKCPKNKKAVKYNTEHNQFFTHKIEIENLTTCLKFWEKSTTSMWTRLLKNVVQCITRKKKLIKSETIPILTTENLNSN